MQYSCRSCAREYACVDTSEALERNSGATSQLKFVPINGWQTVDRRHHKNKTMIHKVLRKYAITNNTKMIISSSMCQLKKTVGNRGVINQVKIKRVTYRMK